MNASKKHHHPLRFQLRVLAGKLETGAISQSERNGLAKLLRLLAEGESLDDIFDIIYPANRPKNLQIEQRLYEIEVMRLPVKHGGRGHTKAKAIEEVAKIHNISISTIESDFKSANARVIREMVIAQHYNPLELTSEEYKGG